MNTRQGTLNDYHNNQDMVFKFFDTIGQTYIPALTPAIYSANDVLYSSYQGCCTIGMVFLSQSCSVGNMQTNVDYTGPPALQITPPIFGGNHNGGTSFGWSAGCASSSTDYLLNASIDLLQTGLGSTNCRYDQY